MIEQHAPLEYEQPEGRRQIDALDGMRGLAVILVVLSHLSIVSLDIISYPRFAGIGKAGVFLFFLLSAFLLTLQLMQADTTSFRKFSFWRRYALRRILRVWPLYILVLSLSFLSLALAPPTVAGQAEFPLAIFQLPDELQYSDSGLYTMSSAELLNHLSLQEGKGILWSIPVEFKYYFILPFVALAIIFLARRQLLLSCILIAGLVAASLYIWPPWQSPPSTIRLGYYLPIFLLGQLAALAHLKLTAYTSERLRLAMEALAIGCLLLILATIPEVFSWLMGYSDTNFFGFHRQFLFYGLVWAGFLLGTLHGKGYVAWLLSLPMARYLGFISFSVYLWHMSVIHAVQMLPGLTSWQGGMVALAGTIVVSVASYQYYEKVFLRIPISR